MDIVTSQEFPAMPGDDPIQLRDTPWSVRLSRASQGRTALEIYDSEHVVAIVVPTDLITETLLGALGGMRADRRHITLAWGVLKSGQDAPPDVTFHRRRRLGNASSKGAGLLIGDRFWLSVAEGRFAAATALRSDGAVERRAVLR
ncbi:hypothetical protein OHB13_37580 (plasmid) [Streptomyces sp. NBC_00440]|uniref:hypothetical protein n=1 Tax=unclassified Streptomyces TaxID=2593676 RepID=UPI002E1A7701|nr:hypothetical protein OG760_36935 [Streptomyces sp. NBC_00963]